MKSKEKSQASLKQKHKDESASAPVNIHSMLFNRTRGENSSYGVVPETPNNSYSLSYTSNTITGTVLETPDASLKEDGDIGVINGKSNAVFVMERTGSLSKNSDSSDDSMEVEAGDGIVENELDGSLFELTPALLHGRRQNVMSILESEHTFTETLLSKNKNSSMVTSKKPRHNFVSPVKRRKRKSLATVILPFDLNDEHITNKLHAIYERDEASKGETSKTAQRKLASATHGTNKGGSKIDSPKTNMQKRSSVLLARGTINSARVENANYPTTSKETRKTSNTTIIFDSEDIELTPIASSTCKNVNNSVSGIIKGMELHNIMEADNPEPLKISEGESVSTISCLEFFNAKTSAPAVCGSSKLSTSSLQTAAQHVSERQVSCGTPVRNSADDATENSLGSMSIVDAATQPGMILILQDIVAHVDVRISGDNCSEAVKAQLVALGAQVRDKLTPDVTHVVFREGNRNTYKRATKRGLHLVSVLWVEACRENLKRVLESPFHCTSVKSQSHPSLSSRLKKSRPARPKDFAEQERIATARAERRLKILKSVARSPPCSDLGNYTPQRQSAIEKDVNSPLFGIAHLLTPKKKSTDTLSSSDEGEEEATAAESVDLTYVTPLSKKLYKKFMAQQHNGKSPTRSSPGSKSENSATPLVSEVSVVENENLPCDTDEATMSGCTVPGISELLLENRDCGVTDNRLDINTVHKAVCHAEYVTELSTEQNSVRVNSEKNVKYDNVVARISPLQSNVTTRRKSERIRRKFSFPNEGSQRRGFEETVKSDSCTIRESLRETVSGARLRESTANLPISRITIKSKDLVVDPISKCLEETPSSTCPLTETKDSKQRKKRYAPRERAERIRHKSKKGQIKKINLTRKIEMTDEVNERCRLVRCNPCNSNSNVHSELSCNGNKVKGQKLYSECQEPSQELIVPTTPRHVRKHSPSMLYANLQIHSARSQQAAVKDMKGHCVSVSLPKKGKRANVLNGQKSRDKSLGERLKSSSSFLADDNPSRSSLSDNVFSSSGEEQPSCKRRIVHLPSSRKSLEDFVIPKSVRARLKRNIIPSLCLTSVHSSEMKTLVPIIRKLGKYQIVKEVNDTTSHVVCGEERRTLNVLYGIARGAWILDKSWLLESLEMGRWAPEEPFELFNFCPGAKVCRWQKESQGEAYQQTLFSGVGSVFVSEGCVLSSLHLKELLGLCGCNVVSTVRNANIVVCNPAHVSPSRSYIRQVTCISEKWVLDSIQQHAVQNIQNYVVRRQPSSTSGSYSSKGNGHDLGSTSSGSNFSSKDSVGASTSAGSSNTLGSYN